jgi:hypothetical protein
VIEAEAVDQTGTRVFVEAAVMETSDEMAEPEHTCAPDIELQTADTPTARASDKHYEDSETLDG